MAGPAKRIAVLVTDRQSEALRMSLGLLLLGDVVDVYVVGGALPSTEQNRLHLETMKEFEVAVYTDCPANAGLEYVAPAAIADQLPRYDHVLAY